MGLLSLLLFVAGAGSVALFAYRAHRGSSELRSRLWQAWYRAAGRLGWDVVFEPSRVARPTPLRARFGVLEIEVGEVPEAPRAASRIVVRGLGHGPRGLSVKPRSLGAKWAERLGGEGLVLGSPVFDQAFVTLGDPLRAQAVLDGETRAKLAELLGGRVRRSSGGDVEVQASLEASVLDVVLPHGQALPADGLADLLTECFGPVLDLAGRLVEPEDVAGRLAANLGSGGRRSELEAGVRLRTLRLLLGNFRDHPETAKVLAKLVDDDSPAVRLEVAIARGKVEEETLLPWLESTDEETARIAARELGRLGSAAAVPALRALAAMAEGETARAARQAVVEIQARLDTTERGQLSLVGSEAGALSLAEESEPGRLSFAEQEK